MKKITLTKFGKHVIELKKPGEEVEIVGAFETQGSERVTVEVVIHHRAAHTFAKTILKGVVRDKSSLKISGRIIIDSECDQSNSFLTEKILLLSDQARAEAIPDLEILTDDVKCSHAVSITHLDPIQLFYLQSRGLSRIDAEKILVAGFLDKG